MRQLTEAQVRVAVKDTVNDIIEDIGGDFPDRETVIERVDEECDSLFGSLVRSGRIDAYDVDDLIATAQPCGVILAVAQADAWVEDDGGLWEGLAPYGVLASVAFFSLRNLLYQAMKDEGHDTNEDYPFGEKLDEDEVGA